MYRRLTESFEEYLTFSAYKTPVEFCVNDINFKYMKGGRSENFDIDFTPYLRAPISDWEFDGVRREITVVAPEQTGKSLCWQMPLVWSFVFKPCVSIVAYPSDELCNKNNIEKLRPIMRSIPSVNADLNRRHSVNMTDNYYNFPNVSSYFMGAGSRITSISAKIAVADEVDDWTSYEGRVDNMKDLRKRGRSFDENLLVKVCSPTTKSGVIWREFLMGSQGYWYLRCVDGCGQLTMRSCDIHNLQFDAEDGKSIPDSHILVCPKCKKEYKETSKREMNLHGDYIHKFPERQHSLPSYQWGALASQLPALDWQFIADSQLKAGGSGSRQDKMFFDNSVRGLPFSNKRVKNAEQKSQLEKRMCDVNNWDDIENIFLSSDTQDNCFYYVVRAIDKHGNSYKLEHGTELSLNGIDRIIEQNEYEGIKIKLGIIDEGGHRAKEVQAFCVNKPKLYTYKGNTRIGQSWRLSSDSNKQPSKADKKRIIANPKIYQSELLYYIYVHTGDTNAWFINSDTDSTYTDQITNIQPNNNVKNGDDFENWEAIGDDHLFDCEKMWFVILDFAKKKLKSNDWRVGELDGIRKANKDYKEKMLAIMRKK